MIQEKIILSIIKDTGLSRGEISEMVERKVAIRNGISIEDALIIIIKELAEKLEKSRSIKIIIPQEMNTFIGKELRAMNINMRQLFPDIYGLMKHYYPH